MWPPARSVKASPSAWAGWWKKAACSHGAGADVQFRVTDGKGTVPADFDGVLPALFREGQGVVATGAMDAHGTFDRHRSAGQA